MSTTRNRPRRSCLAVPGSNQKMIDHPHAHPHGGVCERAGGDRRPYLQIRDVEGFRRGAARSAALGFDGKWALHPGRIEACNEVYSPRQQDYDHAENILDACQWYTCEAGGERGAAMLGEEMIDEASRKMALVIATKGRTAGMVRGERWSPSQP